MIGAIPCAHYDEHIVDSDGEHEEQRCDNDRLKFETDR
jgi:hypothetical protein